jgi:hypothetical protein
MITLITCLKIGSHLITGMRRTKYGGALVQGHDEILRHRKDITH